MFGFRIKISKADRLFSLCVRHLAKWTCQRCHRKYDPPTQSLQCSHFHSRGNKSVRFDFENAVALCVLCHQRFTANPLEHTDFFLKRLGKRRFDALTVRRYTYQKVDERMIAWGLEQILKKLELETYGKKAKRKKVED